MKIIPQYVPYYSDGDRLAASDYALSDGWFSEFGTAREFERALADYTGRKHCILAANGTVALELAVMALITGQARVDVPAYTHAATVSAVIRAGAIPHFCDVEPDTLCVDMVEVGTPNMVVSFNGRTAKDDGPHCIHDAAQALGSEDWGGMQLAKRGIIACISFSHPKVLSTGQGGAMVTDSDWVAERLRSLREFGRSETGVDHWLRVGTNAKMSDCLAALGLHQVPDLPRRVAVKRAMFARYAFNLAGCRDIKMLPTDLAHVCPWFVDILVKAGRREELAGALRAAGIGTRAGYPCLPHEPAFRGYGNAEDRFPVAERVAQELLWLPSSLTLTDDEIDYVCERIRRIME